MVIFYVQPHRLSLGHDILNLTSRGSCQVPTTAVLEIWFGTVISVQLCPVRKSDVN